MCSCCRRCQTLTTQSPVVHDAASGEDFGFPSPPSTPTHNPVRRGSAMGKGVFLAEDDAVFSGSRVSAATKVAFLFFVVDCQWAGVLAGSGNTDRRTYPRQALPLYAHVDVQVCCCVFGCASPSTQIVHPDTRASCSSAYGCALCLSFQRSYKVIDMPSCTCCGVATVTSVSCDFNQVLPHSPVWISHTDHPTDPHRMWVETFPFDFRDERMMIPFKGLTQVSVSVLS
jgi:hypothetical protein